MDDPKKNPLAECSRWLSNHGRASPRWCARCGLGPCAVYAKGTPKTQVVLAKDEHKVLFNDLLTLISKHKNLPAAELLAIAGDMLGKLIALQDQRTMSREQAIEIVAANMEHGNLEVVDRLRNAAAGNA